MSSNINISVQETLDTVSIGVSDSDLEVNILVEENTDSEVNISIQDGRDGYTPIKGVDYFDGTNGNDGLSIKVNNVGQVGGNISLTTDNIPDDTDKRYVTDAQLVVISNTSGTNTGDEDAASIGAIVNAATDYTTPLDADKIGIWDTANGLLKSVTWLNIKATLKTYFDTLYTPLSDAFDVGLNFVDVETAYYKRNTDFKINTIENPNSLTVTIEVNAVAYVLGTTINTYDEVTVDVDNVGFVVLNCEEV